MYLCGRCHGSGWHQNTRCPVCAGWGVLPGIHATCSRCGGKGADARGYTCSLCYGKGWVASTVQYEDPRITRIPVSTLVAVWISARAGEPSPVGELSTGIAAGILLALQQHREEVGLDEGQQIRRLLREGGWILIAPDGLWHLVEGKPPTRILFYPAHGSRGS
jgi:hypothetical protein